MSIYRDLGLPWVPDRMGSGDVRDLVPLDELPSVDDKPPMGFPSALNRATKRRDMSDGISPRRLCSTDDPCGWCADCLLGSNWT